MEMPRSWNKNVIPNWSQINTREFIKIGDHSFNASAKVRADQVGEDLKSPSRLSTDG